MHAFRSLARSIRGTHDATSRDLLQTLKTADVPVFEHDCAACDDPCHDLTREEIGEHGDALGSYPSRFDVDITSDLAGSTKPYGRQVIISTGKADWPHEVTEVKGSLAEILSDTNSTLVKHSAPLPRPEGSTEKKKDIPSLLDTSSSTRLSVLNGSHRSLSHTPAEETVLVLPDYKFVTGVKMSRAGAEELWKGVLDPHLGRAGKLKETGELKSWPLPYDSVILLCSHKRRDKRCHIAAPILENAFTTVFHARSWTVDTQIDDTHTDKDSLESLPPTASQEQVEARFREHTGDEKRVLVLKISHIGGHKFAGNVIIYSPTGAGVWYGRVTPKEVPTIVDETIIGGKIIPHLLRAGVNASKPGRASLNDW